MESVPSTHDATLSPCVLRRVVRALARPRKTQVVAVPVVPARQARKPQGVLNEH